MIDRYVVALSLGHSGSAWLSKVLNSHFDVMCFHELEIVTYADSMPPRLRSYVEFSEEERLRNTLYLFSPHRYGDSYRVLGTVDNNPHVDRMMAQVQASFPEGYAKTRFYLLFRNPVNQIHSASNAYAQLLRSDPASALAFYVKQASPAIARLELPARSMLHSILEGGDVELQAFAFACAHYLQFLASARELRQAVSYPCLLRLEQLSHDTDCLQDTLREMTGLTYALPGQATEKVNVKSGARSPQTVFHSWSDERRQLFLALFEGRADLLRLVGYDLDDLIGPPKPLAGDGASREVLLECAISRRSLRVARVELANTTEALNELRVRYQEAARKLQALDSLSPRALALAQRLQAVSRRYPRFASAFRWVARAPLQIFRRSPRQAG